MQFLLIIQTNISEDRMNIINKGRERSCLLEEVVYLKSLQ